MLFRLPAKHGQAFKKPDEITLYAQPALLPGLQETGLLGHVEAMKRTAAHQTRIGIKHEGHKHERQTQEIGHAAMLVQHEAADRCDISFFGALLRQNRAHDAAHGKLKPSANHWDGVGQQLAGGEGGVGGGRRTESGGKDAGANPAQHGHKVRTPRQLSGFLSTINHPPPAAVIPPNPLTWQLLLGITTSLRLPTARPALPFEPSALPAKTHRPTFKEEPAPCFCSNIL